MKLQVYGHGCGGSELCFVRKLLLGTLFWCESETLFWKKSAGD